MVILVLTIRRGQYSLIVFFRTQQMIKNMFVRLYIFIPAQATQFSLNYFTLLATRKYVRFSAITKLLSFVW